VDAACEPPPRIRTAEPGRPVGYSQADERGCPITRARGIGGNSARLEGRLGCGGADRSDDHAQPGEHRVSAGSVGRPVPIGHEGLVARVGVQPPFEGRPRFNQREHDSGSEEAGNQLPRGTPREEEAGPRRPRRAKVCEGAGASAAEGAAGGDLDLRFQRWTSVLLSVQAAQGERMPVSLR